MDPKWKTAQSHVKSLSHFLVVHCAQNLSLYTVFGSISFCWLMVTLVCPFLSNLCSLKRTWDVRVRQVLCCQQEPRIMILLCDYYTALSSKRSCHHPETRWQTTHENRANINDDVYRYQSKVGPNFGKKKVPKKSLKMSIKIHFIEAIFDLHLFCGHLQPTLTAIKPHKIRDETSKAVLLNPSNCYVRSVII